MSLQIPMYVYDIHGGEGYLSLENLEKNRSKNFSGRGFSKKSAEEISKEIVEKFEEANKITSELKKYAYEHFCFENNIDKILEIVENKSDVDLEEIRGKHNNKREMLISKGMAQYLIEKYEDILRTEDHKLYTEIKRLTAVEEELRNAIIEKDELIKKQGEIIKVRENQIENYENSIIGKWNNKVNKFKKRKD